MSVALVWLGSATVWVSSGPSDSWCRLGQFSWKRDSLSSTDLFSCVLFSFLPPFLVTPLPLFSTPFLPFSPSKNALFCRARDTAQSLERGSFRMDLSKNFGKEIPSRNLREKRSVQVTSTRRVGPVGFRLECRSLKTHPAVPVMVPVPVKQFLLLWFPVPGLFPGHPMKYISGFCSGEKNNQ